MYAYTVYVAELFHRWSEIVRKAYLESMRASSIDVRIPILFYGTKDLLFCY